MGDLREGDWSAPDVVREFRTTGFSDRGEPRALAAAGDRAQGAVLDVGVGGGRTTGLLASGAQSYLGIDPAAGMVELARGRYPGTDLRVLDVRDLGELSAGSFDLVVFSFNGIDAVDHEDRGRSLRELARVLAPDGRLVVSSLSIDGISYDERPWTVHLAHPRLTAYRSVQLALHPIRWVNSVRNFRRTRRDVVRGPDWAIGPMRAHEFRFLVHFATVGSTVRMLFEAGLVVESAWDPDGAPVDVGAERSKVNYVHYVCRPA